MAAASGKLRGCGCRRVLGGSARNPGRRERGLPDLVAELVTRDVAVGVPGAWRAVVIHTDCPALRAVLGEGPLAVIAAAAPGRIGAERPVPVGAASGVGLGAAKPVRIGQHLERWPALRHGEHKIIVGQAALRA